MLIAGAALVFAQLGLTVTAPDSITARVPATVRVAVSSPVSSAHELVVPKLPPGYTLVRISVSTRVDSAGRRSWWKTSEHELQLTALRTGPFYLPGFEVRSGGSLTRSRPKRVFVRAGAPDIVPEIVTRAPVDLGRAVDFHAVVSPGRVYVGQQATYQVGVFLDDEVRFRLRRNPEFHPPELRSAVAYDLPNQVGNPPIRQMGHRRYEVHVFQRALFPLEPGRYTVPPARLSYALPLSSSFFSREETHTVRAESVSMLVLEPPAAGRPDDYAGAVGQLKVETRLDSATGRVGDPLLLTVRVSGVGNVKFFPRPSLEVPWATAVAAGERVQLDSQALLVRGGKEFDWLLTPRQAGTVTLPALRYPYFNPYTERYELALSPPESLVVAPGTLAAAADSAGADSPPPLEIRTQYRGVPGPPAQERPAFWWAALLAPLPALLISAARRPRRRASGRRLPPAARLRAAADRRAPRDGREARRAFAGALADRLDLPPQVTTRRGALSRALRRAGVTPETAEEAESVLRALDEGAYASDAPPPSDELRSRAYKVYRRVDAEAKARVPSPPPPSAGSTGPAAASSNRLPPRRRDSLALLLAAALGMGAGAAVGHARAVDPAAEAFARGVDAYGRRDFQGARRHFAESGTLAFGAPDAWANFGTAGWVAGDTAAAAVGWQRALRMEPTASDVRERLALLPSGHDGPIASVPRMPASAPALGALALWLMGWLIAAYAAARAIPQLRPVVGVALFASIVMGGTAAYVRDRLAAADLSVFADEGDLRVLPALSAERAHHASTGEVARTLSRQGAWTRVRLDGDREGWVETDRLVEVTPAQ